MLEWAKRNGRVGEKYILLHGSVHKIIIIIIIIRVENDSNLKHEVGWLHY